MSVFRTSPSGQKAGELLGGVNLTTDDAGRLSPCARSRRFFDWDWFCTGNEVSGQIGRMGWTLLGTGTPAYTRLSSPLSGVAKARLSTSATTAHLSTLTLGQAANRLIANPLDVPSLQWAWRMSGSVATKRAFFGWNSNLNNNPNTNNANVFGVFFDSGLSPNYFILNKNGNASSFPIDTGVVVPANAGQLFTMVKTFAGPKTYDIVLATDEGGIVNERYLAQDVNLAAPTAGYTANLGFFVQTLSNAVTSLELGYWSMVNTFGGLYSGDLEA